MSLNECFSFDVFLIILTLQVSDSIAFLDMVSLGCLPHLAIRKHLDGKYRGVC
jgi:hypothetical protein